MCIYDYPYHYAHSRYYSQRYKINSAPDALFHQGPFVDIIPIDEADGDTFNTRWLEWRYMRSVKRYRRCLCHKNWIEILDLLKQGYYKSVVYWSYRNILYPHKHQKRYYKSFITAEDHVRETRGNYYFCYFHVYPVKKELFDKSIFDSFEMIPFEDIMIRVPIKYDKYLSQLFGDYMQLPPEEKRKRHYTPNLEVVECTISE